MQVKERECTSSSDSVLHLELSEAFFLSYALGCLTVEVLYNTQY